MKQKHSDKQSISDILKKLQESYLSPKKSSEKEKPEAYTDEDLEMRKKIEDSLRASASDKEEAPAPKASKPARKRAPAKKEPEKVASPVPETEIEEDEITYDNVDEPSEEMVPDSSNAAALIEFLTEDFSEEELNDQLTDTPEEGYLFHADMSSPKKEKKKKKKAPAKSVSIKETVEEPEAPVEERPAESAPEEAAVEALSKEPFVVEEVPTPLSPEPEDEQDVSLPSLPVGTADFVKKSPAKEPAPIVIKPRESKKAMGRKEPIVIKPREAKKVEEVKPTAPAVPSEPIRITPKQAPSAASAPKAAQKQKSSAVSVPKAAPAPQPAKSELKEEKKSASATKHHTPSKHASPAHSAPKDEKKRGLDKNDLALIFELGYGSDLGRMVGNDKMKKLKYEYQRQKSLTDHEPYHATAFGLRASESAETDAPEQVLAAYAHDCKHLFFRFFSIAVLTLCLLFADLPVYGGARLSTLATSIPLALPVAGVALLALVALLSRRTLVTGLKELFSFRASPYSVSALLLIPTLLYDGLLLYRTQLGGAAGMMPINFLCALSFLTVALCDVIRIVTEVRAFRLLCEEGEQYVPEPTAGIKKKMRRGNHILRILNDDIDTRFYTVTRAKQVCGFFRRFNNLELSIIPMTVLISTVFAVSIVGGIVTLAYTSSGMSALTVLLKILFLGAPTSFLLGQFYSLFAANRLLSERKCAIIGQESLEEYDTEKTVIFPDTALFESKSGATLSVLGGNDFKSDVKLASAFFAKLGGTLACIGDNRDELPVSILHITDHGCQASVGDGHMLLVGDTDYMKLSGLRLPDESTDRIVRRAINTGVLYVAIDGVLKLSYEIEYKTRSDFESLIHMLADDKTHIAVRTYDPNLNAMFLDLNRATGTAELRLMRSGRYDEPYTPEVLDAGAIAKGSAEELSYPLHAAVKVRDAQRSAYRLQLFATLLGAVLMGILTFFGHGDKITPLSILCYQLLWCVLTLPAIHLEVSRRNLRIKRPTDGSKST